MSITSIRRIALAATAAVLLAVPATVASAPAAGAAPYPPDTGPMTLTATTVSAGGSLTVGGSSFKGEELVAARLTTPLRRPDPTLLGVFKTDTTGKLSGDVRIPRSTPAGSYVLSLTGSESGLYLSANIKVSGRPGGPGHHHGPGYLGFPGFPGYLGFLGFSDRTKPGAAAVNIDTAPVADRVEQPETRPGRTLAVAGAAAALSAFVGGAYLMRRRRRG
jgi:hypothetical protein